MDTSALASAWAPLSKMAARDEAMAVLIIIGAAAFFGYRAWKGRDKK